MVEDKEKYDKCWVCGSLILKNRVEEHHIMGQDYSDEKTKLCILCHDLVDRMPLENIDVFQEFLINTLNELKSIEGLKWTKLYILKLGKIIPFALKFPSNKLNENIGDTVQ